MALTTPELLYNVSELLKKLGEAIEPGSDAGAKISLSEIVNIVTNTLTKLGIDIADED